MKTEKLRILVTTALFTALCCIATMVIQIPTPTGGYIHIGDAFVILSGILLGPVYGFAAAGIGSMLADILSGYMAYAIATFIIKGLAAFVCGLVYKKFKKHSFVLIGAVASCFIVTAGYLLFEAWLLGNGFAATIVGVPSNLLQGFLGIIISVVLYPILKRVPQIREMLM